MGVRLDILDEADASSLYDTADLQRLAEHMCTDEGLEGDIEISVLLCDDAAIRRLNAEYRDKDTATDVLAFEQPASPHSGPRLLGDIVISVETVRHRCGDASESMREEIRMLLCHGLLHLLGYDHTSGTGEREMAHKQAHYLNLSIDRAWPTNENDAPRGAVQPPGTGGNRSVGRRR